MSTNDTKTCACTKESKRKDPFPPIYANGDGIHHEEPGLLPPTTTITPTEIAARGK